MTEANNNLILKKVESALAIGEAERAAKALALQEASTESQIKATDIASSISLEQNERDALTFTQDNEDRIADSLASSLISLGDTFDIITATDEEIQAMADENGITVDTLKAAISAREDELRGVAIDERSSLLQERQFEETQAQNAIANEMKQQGINISAGNLALARQKYEDEQGAAADETLAAMIDKEAASLVEIAGEGGEISPESIANQAAIVAEQLNLDPAIVQARLESKINEGLGITDEDLVDEDDTVAPTGSFSERGLGAIGTGEGVAGLTNLTEATWESMEAADRSKYLPKYWVNKSWNEVRKYIFGE